MSYGKRDKILYMGIPSGSLHNQVVRLLEKSGRAINKGRQYELNTPYDGYVVFRILDRKEMPEKVAKGIVLLAGGGNGGRYPAADGKVRNRRGTGTAEI